MPIAVIEAKDNNHSVGDGMQKALDYAETLHIPFVFSSNGDGFVFHDRTGASAKPETTLALDAFPSPADLWARYRAWKGLTPTAERIVLQDYFEDAGGKRTTGMGLDHTASSQRRLAQDNAAICGRR